MIKDNLKFLLFIMVLTVSPLSAIAADDVTDTDLEVNGDEVTNFLARENVVLRIEGYNPGVDGEKSGFKYNGEIGVNGAVLDRGNISYVPHTFSIKYEDGDVYLDKGSVSFLTYYMDSLPFSFEVAGTVYRKPNELEEKYDVSGNYVRLVKAKLFNTISINDDVDFLYGTEVDILGSGSVSASATVGGYYGGVKLTTTFKESLDTSGNNDIDIHSSHNRSDLSWSPNGIWSFGVYNEKTSQTVYDSDENSIDQKDEELNGAEIKFRIFF